MTAELHLVSALRAVQLPGVAQVQPLVGDLHLPAVLYLLVENAVFIADAVTDGGNLQAGE